MFLKRAGAYLTPFVAAGFMVAVAAGSASAATARPHNGIGAQIGTTSAAGYQAQGRDFRYITAKLTVPDWFSNSLYPQEYIQLSNGSLTQQGGTSGDQYVRAGVEPCTIAKDLNSSTVCTVGDWVAFVEAFNNSLNFPYWEHVTDLAGVTAGDGVDFSIYFDQAGNELHFTVTPPATSGPEEFYKTEAFGPIFDHAAVLDDFLDSVTGAPVPLPPGFNPISINSAYEAALTTYNGTRGSLIGAWTTNEVLATSNGLLPPDGTTRVDPGALFSDGKKVNGAVRADDGFGPVRAVG